MSTLLTPIVTQLNIDRERFKQLINGDINATVQLEFRIERSIAGMVAQRIDTLAIDLIDALQQANESVVQAAASERNAVAAEAAAEGHKTAAADIKTAVELIKSEVVDLRGETFDFKNQSEGLYNLMKSLMGQATGADMLELKAITPYKFDSVSQFNSANFHLTGQLYTANSDRVRWISRTFKLIKMNTGFTEVDDVIDATDDGVTQTPANYTEVQTTTVVNDSLPLPSVSVNTTSWYAWKFEDQFELKNTNDYGEVFKNDIDWVLFKFNNTMPNITKPTATLVGNALKQKLTPVINISGGVAANSTNPISNTVVVVYDDNNNVVHNEILDGNLTTLTIPAGVLKHGKKYRTKVQKFVKLGNVGTPTRIYSPYSDFVNFTTEVSESYIPFYQTKSVSTSAVINVEDSTVYRVNASTNKTLTLSKPTLPSSRAMSIVIFVEDSGGTITWPTEISWAGANEPVLGTSWTNVMIFWTGSMWIGMEGAKR